MASLPIVMERHCIVVVSWLRQICFAASALVDLCETGRVTKGSCAASYKVGATAGQNNIPLLLQELEEVGLT